MALINVSRREICYKIVYYGIALCGKKTNLQYIHKTIRVKEASDMAFTQVENQYGIGFDFVPLIPRTSNGFQVRLQLYSIPWVMARHQGTLSELNGADCVVFVVDSSRSKLEENCQSWTGLEEQLMYRGLDPYKFRIVIQWNKRDLPDAIAVPTLHQQLNPYRTISVEAIATRGKGVIETLEAATNLQLR